MQVRVFNSVHGAPIEGNNIAPASQVSWKLGYNEPDDITLTLPTSLRLATWGARRKLRPWRTLVAIIDNGQVIAAGPVKRRKWTPAGLTVNIGGGWSLFEKRLVLNRVLQTRWVNGEVVIDEDDPAPEWLVSFAGRSLRAIGAGLVSEALAWGPLAIDDPPASMRNESGIHIRNYLASDMATTADRLQDLTEVLNGPRIHFDPYLRADGHLRFTYAADQGGATIHRGVTSMRGHAVTVTDVDEDGDSMATQAYGIGGKQDDVTLVARSTSAKLTEAGWPVMQVANASHNSVSRLDTLLNHTEQTVTDGSRVPESTQYLVRASRGVRPGDVLDVSTTSAYHGQVEQLVDVVDVSGSLSEWCTVTGFPQEVDDA